MTWMQRLARIPAARQAVVVTTLCALSALGVPAPAVPALAAAAHAPAWQIMHLGGPADLRGISPVNSQVVWASGSHGAVLRTTDGGLTWHRVSPPGTRALEFRGLQAFDADHAVLMSIGNHPDDFRIYLTADGGRHWSITNQNRNPQAFYDCMAFFNRERGLAMSDPVNGKFRILITNDGGLSWHVGAPGNMPPAHPGEFGFAASNSCITTSGPRDAWFGSGGKTGSRVFHSSDRGRTWTVARTPIQRGAAAGIFSVAFQSQLQGLAIGGDFTKPRHAPHALALTTDGGRTWTMVGPSAAPAEYRSGATWIPGMPGTALAVGLSGSDFSTDGGFDWQRFDSGSFDAVVCSADGSCWASGAGERIGRLMFG
jgi:photosystem II stability/assembly factor-like uncharacterized protein